MSKRGWRLIQIMPLILLGLGIWIYRDHQSEIRLQMARAKKAWRDGEYIRAIELYQGVSQRHPSSRYAPHALWELATIHYYQSGDIVRAAVFFQRLAEEHADHPLAFSAELLLSEIHEEDLDELPKAARILQTLIDSGRAQEGQRDQVLFRLARIYFKMNEFTAARERLQPVLEQSDSRDLVQKAHVLAGNIEQIQNRYESSLNHFLRVLEDEECPDCHLQARLGLIQGYEFLNDLPNAIRIAQSIPEEQLSAEMKRHLIQRLTEKRRLEERQ